MTESQTKLKPYRISHSMSIQNSAGHFTLQKDHFAFTPLHIPTKMEKPKLQSDHQHNHRFGEAWHQFHPHLPFPAEYSSTTGIQENKDRNKGLIRQIQPRQGLKANSIYFEYLPHLGSAPHAADVHQTGKQWS